MAALEAAAAKSLADAAATLPDAASSRRPHFGDCAPWLETQCATCGSRPVKLLKCAKCGLIRYCSKECQVRAWKELGHKRSCGNPLPTREVFATASIETVVTMTREFHGADAGLVEACVQRLATAVVPSADPTGARRRQAAAAGIIETLLLVLERHPKKVEVVGPACVAVKHVLRDATSAVKQSAVDACVVRGLVTILQEHHDSSGMMEHGLGALSNIITSADPAEKFSPHVAHAHKEGVADLATCLVREHRAHPGLGLIEGCQVLTIIADPSVGGPAKIAAAGAIEVAIELLETHPQLCVLCFRAMELLKHATFGTDGSGLERKVRSVRAGLVEAVTSCMLQPIQMRRSMKLKSFEAVVGSEDVYESGSVLLYNLYGYVLAGGAGAFGPAMVTGCEELAAELAARCNAAGTVRALEAVAKAAARWPNVVDECQKALAKVRHVSQLQEGPSGTTH